MSENSFLFKCGKCGVEWTFDARNVTRAKMEGFKGCEGPN